MSLFRRRRTIEDESRGWATMSGTRFWVGGGEWPTGSTTETNPLRSVAHAAARDVLCSAVASMPVDQFRDVAGTKVEVTPSPIVADPTGGAGVDQQAWVYSWVDSWMESGNFYGRVEEASSMGLPTVVTIIPPSAVSWLPVGGRETPMLGGEPQAIWPHGTFVHVPYKPAAGSRVGRSPQQLAAQSVSTAVAAEKFGGDFFAASGHPLYDIAASTELNQEQAEGIKAAWERAVKDRRPWVHGNGVTATPMSVDMKASQFIELLQFECLQAARIYRVPPVMIYATVSGQNITYENATQADLAFLKWSLRYPLRRIEQAWSAWLPRPQFVRFNRDAILEMTTLERAEVHKLRLDMKTRTINEVRRLEDEPPFGPEFDEPGIPGGGDAA